MKLSLFATLFSLQAGASFAQLFDDVGSTTCDYSYGSYSAGYQKEFALNQMVQYPEVSNTIEYFIKKSSELQAIANQIGEDESMTHVTKTSIGSNGTFFPLVLCTDDLTQCACAAFVNDTLCNSCTLCSENNAADSFPLRVDCGNVQEGACSISECHDIQLDSCPKLQDQIGCIGEVETLAPLPFLPAPTTAPTDQPEPEIYTPPIISGALSVGSAGTTMLFLGTVMEWLCLF